MSQPDPPPPQIFEDAIAKVVPVIDETLEVGIRVVERGGYRIDKQVTVREQVVDEPLHASDVLIERVEIGRLLPTMDVPTSRQEGAVWVIPVVEEVLVTEKRLRLKEEIRITRVESTFRRPQVVSLRSEEVSVERLEP